MINSTYKFNDDVYRRVDTLKPDTCMQLFTDTMELVHAKPGTCLQLFTNTIELVHAKTRYMYTVTYKYNRTGTCKIRYMYTVIYRYDKNWYMQNQVYVYSYLQIL